MTEDKCRTTGKTTPSPGESFFSDTSETSTTRSGRGKNASTESKEPTTAYTLGTNERNKSQGLSNYVVIPIAQQATYGEGEAKTLSPDAEGRMRLRDPGFGIGEAGDPSFTVPASGAPMVAHTLKAEGSDASEDGTGRGVPIVAQTLNANYGRRTDAAGSHGKGPVNLVTGASVRRLTPVECERLQGFPDDWTQGESDSARYRMLGNAVAVPVAEWISARFLSVKASTP